MSGPASSSRPRSAPSSSQRPPRRRRSESRTGPGTRRCSADPTARGSARPRRAPAAGPPAARRAAAGRPGLEHSWPWGGAASRRSGALPVLRRKFDATPRSRLSSEPRRTTMLGFQPPAIGEEEIAAVAETLRSGWLTTGPKAAELERRFAEYVEAEHVLAVASRTAALHLSLLAVGVGPGDEVITSPITWPATANVIEHCGARPVFCDVRADDLNLDVALVPELVTERTKAILPVHLAGQPCDLDPLLGLS